LNEGAPMVSKDDEIDVSRLQDHALAGHAKREAAERKRIFKIFSKKALQAIKAKDARAYAEQLRLLKISGDSEEWRNAWKFFYAG
jgi:hypothetical protein